MWFAFFCIEGRLDGVQEGADRNEESGREAYTPYKGVRFPLADDVHLFASVKVEDDVVHDILLHLALHAIWCGTEGAPNASGGRASWPL